MKRKQEKLNLSQKRVLDLIKREETFDMNDMGFILTVLRDNCLDDDLHRYIEILLGELWEKRN